MPFKITKRLQVNESFTTAEGEITLTLIVPRKKSLLALKDASDEELMQFMNQHIAGWDNIVGDDDQPLEYNADNLNAVLDALPGLVGGIAERLYGLAGEQGAAKKKRQAS